MSHPQQTEDGGPAEKPILRDMTRTDFINGLRELKKLAEAAERKRDPSFRRWPDLDDMIDYIEEQGLAPKTDALLTARKGTR